MLKADMISQQPIEDMQPLFQLSEWSNQDAARIEQLPWNDIANRVLPRFMAWLEQVPAADGSASKSPRAHAAMRMLTDYIDSLRGDPGVAIQRARASNHPLGLDRKGHLSGQWFLLRAIIDVLFDQDTASPILHEQVQSLMKRAAIDAWVDNSQQESYYAFHDAVTTGANRLATQLQLDTLVRMNRPFVLFYADLDGFKAVNDTYGHAAGDMVLNTVSHRWQRLMRQSDWLGRWGGDEFLMLVPDLHVADAIASFGSRIRKTCEDPIVLASRDTVSVSAAYGYARFPEEGDTVAELLEVADQRLYAAKRFLANGLTASISDLNDARGWRQRIHEALDERRIEVHYQPIIHAESHAPRQWEAFVRYRSNDGRMHVPAEFLAALPPDAVRDLDHAVLRRVFEDLTHWRSLGHQFGVSINVDPSELLMDGWVPYLHNLHAEFSNVHPQDITFEIRESLAPIGIQRLIEALGHLTRQGYQVALDDFGTGVSTLSRMQQLPIQVVKIDSSVTREWNSEAGRILIQSIISLSQPMGFRVVAEGIETRDQKIALDQWGCHASQGWFYTPALPAGEVSNWELKNSAH